MKRTFVSFDIFDTCLIRRCGEPHKIWDLMAEELFDKDDVRGRLSFVGNRRVVEQKVAAQIKDPTFEDIYRSLNVSQWNFEVNDIMQKEMDMEERELFPNPRMLNVVKKYREKGCSISFISDMYLPSTFLKRILKKYEFAKDEDPVFVSAECKAGKYDGKLFDFALKKLSANENQWIHYGDNFQADFMIPRAKGIKAFHVKDTNFSEEELRWISDSRFYKHKHEIELWSGLCRLQRIQTEEKYSVTMAIDFVSSLYIPYVHYVVEESLKKHIQTIFFVARDGHIFYEIANEIKKGDAEGKYLKLSRKSLYPCVFFKVDDYELSLTIDQMTNQSVKQCLKYIDLTWEELSEATRREFSANTVLNSIPKLNGFKNCLKQNERLRILERSKERRHLLLQYLKQEGVLDGNNALVDLGWVGSGRIALNYILKNLKKNTLFWFYWGYNNSLYYGTECDDLNVYNTQYDLFKDHSCSNLFLEQYASMNVDGSTIGYEERHGKIVPVEGRYHSVMVDVAKINERSSREMARLSDRLCLSVDAYNEIFLCCGLKQFDLLLSHPTKQAIKFFSRVDVENFGATTKLAQKLSIKDMIALLIWGIPVSSVWTEASLKKTCGFFAPLYKFLYKYTSSTSLAANFNLWWKNRK